MQHNQSRFMLFLGSIFLLLGVAIALIWAFMHPPMDDLRALTLFMSITGFGSAVIGFVSLQMGWWRKLGSLHVALTLGYVLAGALTLLNVWVTANLMFINQHDFLLGVILLIFASGISVAFGYFISGSIMQNLRDLVTGAGRVAEGDFSVRVPVEGRDEVARLTAAFNEMATKLEQMELEAKALDEARRNLVAWASHDLRTPLASLRAMVDALADGVAADPDTAARYLRQSQTEITRMAGLINDLFDLAQLDAGHMPFVYERSSIGDLISDTLAAFTARAQASTVELTGSVDSDVDPVEMAVDKISRVLHNLVDNALRHTPGGGSISICAMRQSDQVHVTVKDTGAGISAEDLPHIFERFYRGEKSRSRAGGGAGLGLAIARRLIEAHGGEMHVESTPGTGTSMHFTLPRERKETENGDQPALDAGGSPDHDASRRKQPRPNTD